MMKSSILGAALILAALPVSARDLRYSHGFAASSAVGEAAEEFGAAVAEKSAGAVTFRIFPMSLMTLIETGPGVRDGLADMGYVLAPYTPSDYPYYSFLHELSMSINLRPATGRESLAYAGAMMDYTFNNCPQCQADFAAQNQVYLSGATSSVYALLCNKPVVTPEDLKGKRIRAGSPSFSRLSDHFGANGIQMPANEVFEGLSQNVLDCAMLSAPELTTYSLKDVVTDITLGLPGGIYAGAAVGNMNLDTWRGLSDADKAAVWWGANVLSADISWNYHAQDTENLTEARGRGIQIHQASDALIAEVRRYTAEDLDRVVQIFTDSYGLQDGAAHKEAFLAVLEKWYGLVEGVNSREDLRALYWQEIYAKIDPATYAR